MIIEGDCLSVLKTQPAESVDCVVTSPPYWGLRDYGTTDQLGLEANFDDYINKLCDVYGGSGKGFGGKNSWAKSSKPSNTRNSAAAGLPRNNEGKCLLQIPSRFAIEMINRGWILRNEIIWHKPNSMPASVKDRFTVDYEKLFFFTKSRSYYFKQQFEKIVSVNDKRTDTGRQTYKAKYKGDEEKTQRAFVTINSEGRNKRTVWSIPTSPYNEAHFAVYPRKLVEPCIVAGCPEGGVVLDPFMGSGTTAVVAEKLKRKWIGIEISAEYIKIANKRINAEPIPLL